MCTNGYFPCSLAFLLAYEGEGIVFGGFKGRKRNHAPVLREQILFEGIFLFSFLFSFYFLGGV